MQSAKPHIPKKSPPKTQKLRRAESHSRIQETTPRNAAQSGNLICTVNEIRLSEVRGWVRGLGRGHTPPKGGRPLPKVLTQPINLPKLVRRKRDVAKGGEVVENLLGL